MQQHNRLTFAVNQNYQDGVTALFNASSTADIMPRLLKVAPETVSTLASCLSRISLTIVL
ncbi:MAG: hypothetical protein WCD89_21575 [Anaerocolumna sp.]